MNAALPALVGLLLVAAPAAVEKKLDGLEGQKWVVRTEHVETPAPPHDVHRLTLTRENGISAVVASFEEGASTSGLGSFRHSFEFRVDADQVFEVVETRVEAKTGIKSSTEQASVVVHRWNGKQFVPGPEKASFAEIFKPARGDEWRVNKIPGAPSTKTFEQWFHQVMRKTPAGFEEAGKFEESMVTQGKPETVRRKKAQFSIDDDGVFQVVQTATVKPAGKPEKIEKVAISKWDGKAFVAVKGAR
jgi:hypothetical protein